MFHNINRRPNYPTKGSNKKLQAKAKRKKIGTASGAGSLYGFQGWLCR